MCHLPLLYKHLNLNVQWQTFQFVSLVTWIGMYKFLPREDFFTSHPDPPFMGASDIGQENAIFSTHMYQIKNSQVRNYPKLSSVNKNSYKDKDPYL